MKYYAHIEKIEKGEQLDELFPMVGKTFEIKGVKELKDYENPTYGVECCNRLGYIDFPVNGWKGWCVPFHVDDINDKLVYDYHGVYMHIIGKNETCDTEKTKIAEDFIGLQKRLKDLYAEIGSNKFNVGSWDYFVDYNVDGQYTLFSSEHKMSAEQKRTAILEGFCELTCAKVTELYREIGLFDERDKVTEYNPTEIGELIGELNGEGYDVNVSIEVLHDYYIVVKTFENDGVNKEAEIYGIGESNDDWEGNLQFVLFTAIVNAMDDEQVGNIYEKYFA